MRGPGWFTLAASDQVHLGINKSQSPINGFAIVSSISVRVQLVLFVKRSPGFNLHSPLVAPAVNDDLSLET